MKKRVLLAITLVAVVAISIWFAVPTLAFQSAAPDQVKAGLKVGYGGPGQLQIINRNEDTGVIIALPGKSIILTSLLGYFPPLQVVDNGPYDSDANLGIIMIQNLPLGNYSFVEDEAPNGYYVNTQPQNANLTSGAPVIRAIDETPVTGVPASSNLGMIFVIGGLAAMIVVALVLKGRRSVKA